MRVRMLGVTAALALALTGCGAEAPGVASAGGDPTASAAPSLDREERGLKWAQCMRENGVDVPDPKPGEGIRMTMGPGTQEKMEQAREACKEWQPAGGGRADGESNDDLLKIAACMRENGVENFPDPEGGRVRITKDVGDDPDFEAAQKKCQMDRPK
ncbi:hypothetical protein [Nonomuraea ferruginea]|uniref:Subtilisin inhibitor-like n=1 Tax=Nonomuraea ferruginea TaxID=46174 RepID=A0ABT4SYF8_9ACTN|nr:hypothetical protein [Nonomuraea ferruginea]MDA0642293.1 hypothetical protein [Nonomuraea ferruginea]